MSRTTVSYYVCDFCLKRATDHPAYRTFGYVSDGAGLAIDFCDHPTCCAEAQEIACRRNAQVFYPRTITPEGREQ